jgi:D-alanine-D-alanine ligase
VFYSPIIPHLLFDYKNYDPPRDLRDLLPGHQVDHVFLNKLYTYKQLAELRYKGYDIFVNLCEGYLDWDIPSIDVIYALENAQIAFYRSYKQTI